VARQIKLIRHILAKKEEGNADPNLDEIERRLMMRTAGILLMGAITSSKKLHEVADALDADEGKDPRQANILKAYEDCVEGRYPPTVKERGERFVTCSVPTFTQLKDAFIKRFGPTCWTSASDFGVRKTLKILGLPLSKSKKGRPVGARNQVIRNQQG